MTVPLKSPQATVFGCDQRFRVLVAGRRFGKTFLALVELCQAAWGRGRLAWYVAPTYKQAKRIAWKPLKELTRPYWAARPNETDLRIELVSGGTICLRGADNYDCLRGDGLDFLVLDEYASIAREAWTEVLRPALSDKQGRALFIGTPLEKAAAGAALPTDVNQQLPLMRWLLDSDVLNEQPQHPLAILGLCGGGVPHARQIPG